LLSNGKTQNIVAFIGVFGIKVYLNLTSLNKYMESI